MTGYPNITCSAWLLDISLIQTGIAHVHMTRFPSIIYWILECACAVEKPNGMIGMILNINKNRVTLSAACCNFDTGCCAANRIPTLITGIQSHASMLLLPQQQLPSDPQMRSLSLRSTNIGIFHVQVICHDTKIIPSHIAGHCWLCKWCVCDGPALAAEP